MFVIPHPLLANLVKGEHFILVNLFNSIPGSSSQAGSTQARVVKGALVEFVRSDQLPLTERDPQPAPQATKKKAKKGGQTKAVSVGLEGFVD